MVCFLKYQHYKSTINYIADDNVFDGKITGITDLVTFEGNSPIELKKAIRCAIDDHIKICIELGKLSANFQINRPA